MSDPSAPFDFRTRLPGPPLSRFAASLWYARGRVAYARERIAPTGSTVAVFVLGDPIVQTPDDGHGTPLRAARGFLLGPHDRPVVNQRTGETFAVGIISTPVGCQALFGCLPASLRGRSVELEPHWPAAAELRARLLRAGSPEAMLALLERHLAAQYDSAVAGWERCALAVAWLEEEPARPIAEIAARLGISHGHLDREFTRVVGLTPRALARLLRLQRLLAGLDVRTEVDWPGLALRHGWFDQAHFIRDFRRHTGTTPTRYLATQRAHFTPDEMGDAAGFVPEP